MISIGKKVAFVSEQTGHSIRTLEARYKKGFPTDDDLEVPGILSTHAVYPEAKVHKAFLLCWLVARSGAIPPCSPLLRTFCTSG